MKSAYEPAPLYGCNHIWVNEGHPVVTWYSGGANTTPPPGAPLLQKRRCVTCGGFELALAT